MNDLVYAVYHQHISWYGVKKAADRRCHDLPKRTGADRNGPTKIPKRTSMGTETDRNRLQWVPKRTGADFNLDRNELQWEQEKVGWGTIGTILIKLCMYC